MLEIKTEQREAQSASVVVVVNLIVVVALNLVGVNLVGVNHVVVVPHIPYYMYLSRLTSSSSQPIPRRMSFPLPPPQSASETETRTSISIGYLFQTGFRGLRVKKYIDSRTSVT